MKKAKAKRKEIKGKESWRDLNMTKTCDSCGKKYHPRKNSYRSISRFCCQACALKELKKTRIF